jgi:hypothetical protein
LCPSGGRKPEKGKGENQASEQANEETHGMGDVFGNETGSPSLRGRVESIVSL